MTRKIVVLGSGGTIAGTAANGGDNVGYTAAQLGVGKLLESLPALTGVLRNTQLVTEQVAQVDSKDMEFGVWQRLALRASHWLSDPSLAGIVITHGTDTLEETAYFLHRVLPPGRPVVLTCAMRPSTSLQADGPQNLLDAVAVGLHPQAQGVLAVCAGTIHAAQDVQKVHPYRLDAFDSGDAGPLGFIEEGTLRLVRNWPEVPVDRTSLAIEKIVFEGQWPWVEIVQSHAGATGMAVDALVARGVNGLVVAGTGNGTVHHALEDALCRAQDAGVRVVRTTRCAYGRVIPVPGQRLADFAELPPVKARIALMLELRLRN